MPFKEKHINSLITALFFIIILLPISVQLGKNTSDIAKIENRKKASFPHLKKDSIGLFFKEVNNYYKDNFGLREYFSNIYLQFKYKILHESPKPSVTIIGKKGFFYLGNKFSNVVEESYGQKFFSDKELIKRRKRFKERLQWLKSRGIAFYIVIPPNKHTLYKEYFPYKYKYTQTRKQQWIEYMTKAGLGEHIIDLEKHLRPKKRKGLLYQKLDSHWNELGAFYAYQAIIDHINTKIPIKKLSLKDYKITYKKELGGNSGMIGLKIKEENPILTPIFDTTAISESNYSFYKSDKIWEHRNINTSKKYKILLFRDSFATLLRPYLSQTFGECSCIWNKEFDKKIIEKEKPDIVIIEHVERYLERI